MSKPKLSCGRCWTRAFSTVASSILLVAIAALQVSEPGTFGALTSWGLAVVELLGVVGLWLIFEAGWIESSLLALALVLTGAYTLAGRIELALFPAMAAGFLSALKWVNRPQMSCACGLRHIGTETAQP